MDGARCEVLTVKQLATLIGVTPNTIYRHAAMGSIPTVRPGGIRRVLFSRQWIESQLRGDGNGAPDNLHAERQHLSAA